MAEEQKESEGGARTSDVSPPPIDHEERPGTLSLLVLVLSPFALMVAIAVFYYWVTS